MQTICHKSFLVEFDAIIELGAGFDGYFEKHPEEKQSFPQCNAPILLKHRYTKSRDMFIGNKTETFTKLLNIMSLEPDSAFLEAEYYLTPVGKGRIYEYKNDLYSIAFDFRIDPTAQIEYCAISVSYPKYKEEEIISLIRMLVVNSRSVSCGIFDGDLNQFHKELNNDIKSNDTFCKKKA